MGKRSEALAARIEQGADGLAAFAEGLSDSEWKRVVPPDGRTVGVIIHHVASVYPIEIQLASVLAEGKAITGVTWTGIAEMNAGHAKENSGAGKPETVALLRKNSREAARAVRALADEVLDRAAPVSLNSDAPLTAQFFIEDHALRHSWHHLAKIRGALGK